MSVASARAGTTAPGRRIGSVGEPAGGYPETMYIGIGTIIVIIILIILLT